MKITTIHTLTFEFCCANNPEYVAACVFIEAAASHAGFKAEINSPKLPDGADPGKRCGIATVTGPDFEELDLFGGSVGASLKFMGGELPE